MDYDSTGEELQSPRLGTIEESSLENLILQYEEEIKDLRTKLAQSRAPTAIVSERGYQPKQRKSLEQVSDLLAFGDNEEAANLWRDLGFVPMESERWDEVYQKLQQVALSASQRFEQALTEETAKNFKLETDIRALRRSLRETENEADLLRQSIPASKRSQDPAEVIVLRMQIKALEEGIAARDTDIAEMATEVSLVKAEENRLKLIVEHLKMEARSGDNTDHREDAEDFTRLMQKIQDLTDENTSLGKKIDQQNRLKAIIDEQSALIHQLQSVPDRPDPPSESNSLKAKVQSLEAENELEKNAREEATTKLQETLSRLEAAHSEETLRLTKQLSTAEGLAMQANMRVHSMEEQLTELLGKMSDTERELYREKEKAEELQEQKESIIAEFQRANRLVSEEKAMREALRDEMQELTTRLSQSSKECDELHTECESLRAQVTDFRLKNSKLDSDLRESELKFDLQINAKLSEVAEARKQWDNEKKQIEEKVRNLNGQIETLEARLAEVEREKEEKRIDLDIISKKKEVIEDDYVGLKAAYETLQGVCKSQSEAQIVELSQMKQTLRNTESERQLLESRIHILEESREEYEKMAITHNILTKEHLKCENKLLKQRLEHETEQENEAKLRDELEVELKQAKVRYQYALNAFRVRETELMELRIANEQMKVMKVGEGEKSRRQKSGAFDLKDREISGLQAQLKTNEATISELQKRLISLMSQKTPIENKTEHQVLKVSFPQGEMGANEGELVNSVQRLTVEWLNSLPDSIKHQLKDPKIEAFLETPHQLDIFLAALSDKLQEITEILTVKEPSPACFHTIKANELLDKLDRGQGPIDSAVFLNFLIENRLLHAELLKKSEEMIETNACFQPNYSERPENEKEVWAIQRWHDAEKEAARLRSEQVAVVQRFEDFYRKWEGEVEAKEENKRLVEEVSRLKEVLGKSQSRVKEVEGRLEASQTVESQRSSFEGVISTLRSQLSKSEGEHEAFKSAWDRVIAGLKVELMDFGGEYQPTSKDTPETVMLGIISAWKNVRVGLNQRISELEKRLASWSSERDSLRVEKSALEQAKEQARQEADRFRADNRQLRLKLEEAAAKNMRSQDNTSELEMQSKLQTLTSRLRGELDELRVSLATAQNKVVALESQLQVLSSENAALKANSMCHSQDLQKDLQTKSELIERLVGDNENTKQKYHKKQLALLELLNEKEEALKRSQLESVQLTTASWSFRRRSRGEGGPTHKQVS